VEVVMNIVLVPFAVCLKGFLEGFALGQSPFGRGFLVLSSNSSKCPMVLAILFIWECSHPDFLVIRFDAFLQFSKFGDQPLRDFLWEILSL
jgi:hypothetical protein